MNYFLLPEVSNSNLIDLRRAFYAEEYRDLSEVYKFGNLVDAMLTESHRVDSVQLRLEDDGEWIEFTPHEFLLAQSLTVKAEQDPIIRAFIHGGESQRVFTNILQFIHDGDEYIIPARCKFDTIKQAIKTGADYKTTACTTLKAFIASIEFFNYDQQAAWYMDIAGTDRHWIIGISKKTKEIFKFAIQRGDAIYERGRKKYSFWAHLWLQLVEGFKLIESE